MRRIVKRTIGAGAVLLLAGCEAPAPTSDTTSPAITVIVSSARGRNIFKSADGVLVAPDDCIEVPEGPIQLILIAGDSGGIQRTSIRALPASIDPGSLEVTPPAPESSVSVRSDRGAGVLEIALTPPGPGTVRTGATAVLELTGNLPIGVVAQATDYAGNRADLPQFTLRATNDAAVCRNDR